MKKTILSAFGGLIPIFSGLSLIVLNLSVHAQMNDRFYLNTGSWTATVMATPNYSIKLAKDLGAKGAGNGVKIVWRYIQDSLTTPPSQWTWASIDATILALQNDTLDMYAYVLCVGPKKVSPNSCNSNFNPSGPNGGESWFPEDTAKWKLFIDALIDRYDGDGTNDFSLLKYPVNKWRIETEWQSFWCSQLDPDDTSLVVAQKFVEYVNMTANAIKTKQPTFTVSFAGMDPIHDRTVFYDGYTAPEQLYCRNPTCTSGGQSSLTQPQIASTDPAFLPKRRNMINILRNCQVDEIDIHQYGRWQYIPNTIRWYKDSAYTGAKPINFLEGAGPFCTLCEQIYHQGTDTDGRLPALLVRDNSSYVVYWHMMALADKVKIVSWYRLTPDYNAGISFGDACLLSMNYVKKPSYYVYRFLAKNIFSNPNADSVDSIPELNPNLYHYEVQPMGMHVAWSTNPADSIVVSGTGNLYTWDIPTTCDSLYPTVCDSVFPMNTYNVSGSHTIALNDGVPVFYSWNNVLSGVNQLSVTENISVKVYPNPFSETTTLQITNGRITNYELKMYDLFGREVFPFVIRLPAGQAGNSDSFVIRRGDLPGGMYFYHVKCEQQVIGSGKIIIQ